MMDVGTMIANAAAELVGTPFHWHGRIKGVGLDCAGVVIESFRTAGIEVDFKGRYGKRSQIEIMDSEVSRFCEFIPSFDDCRPGDVWITQVSGDEYHMGIISECGTSIVHADSGPTVYQVVIEPISPVWQDSLIRLYRVKGS